MDAARETLQEAINAGGSTLKDYARASGEPGYFQTRFLVYDREGKACTNCHSRIARSALAGRSTFFCATCQPLGQ